MNLIKEFSYLKGERYKIADVSKFDLVFIKQGSFCFKVNAKLNSSEISEDVIIGEGEYID